MCFYFIFFDFKKTRFFFVIFLLVNCRYYRFNWFFSTFSHHDDRFNFRSSYFNFLFQHRDRIQFSIFFDIEIFFWVFFLFWTFFMKNSFISITIELVSIELSTNSTSIFSIFVFFEKTISRISSVLIKFKFFVFFFDQIFSFFNYTIFVNLSQWISTLNSFMMTSVFRMKKYFLSSERESIKTKIVQKVIFILSSNFYDDIRRKIESKSKQNQRSFTSRFIIKEIA